MVLKVHPENSSSKATLGCVKNIRCSKLSFACLICVYIHAHECIALPRGQKPMSSIFPYHSKDEGLLLSWSSLIHLGWVAGEHLSVLHPQCWDSSGQNHTLPYMSTGDAGAAFVFAE